VGVLKDFSAQDIDIDVVTTMGKVSIHQCSQVGGSSCLSLAKSIGKQRESVRDTVHALGAWDLSNGSKRRKSSVLDSRTIILRPKLRNAFPQKIPLGWLLNMSSTAESRTPNSEMNWILSGTKRTREIGQEHGQQILKIRRMFTFFGSCRKMITAKHDHPALSPLKDSQEVYRDVLTGAQLKAAEDQLEARKVFAKQNRASLMDVAHAEARKNDLLWEHSSLQDVGGGAPSTGTWEQRLMEILDHRLPARVARREAETGYSCYQSG